jgi:hypothetical protein
MTIQILDWRPMRRNSLLGFAKVQLPSGIIITDVTILGGDRGPWASPPSKPMVGTDGVTLKDDNGKTRYTPIIEFSSREIRNRWSSAVIDAMRAAHPEVFADAPPVAPLTDRTPFMAPHRVPATPQRKREAGRVSMSDVDSEIPF